MSSHFFQGWHQSILMQCLGQTTSSMRCVPVSLTIPASLCWLPRMAMQPGVPLASLSPVCACTDHRFPQQPWGSSRAGAPGCAPSCLHAWDCPFSHWQGSGETPSSGQRCELSEQNHTGDLQNCVSPLSCCLLSILTVRLGSICHTEGTERGLVSSPLQRHRSSKQNPAQGCLYK